MQLAALFSTPIAMFEHPGMEAMNREMTEILVAESDSAPSLSVSNVGGWHSKSDLHVRPEACFKKLTELIVSHARETAEAIAKSTGRSLPNLSVKPDMWAMVMRDGNYTIPHTHPFSSWGTVYYADAGDTDETKCPGAGSIHFIDPRNGFLPIPGLDMTVGDFVVQPKTGQLLVFPGWLMHYVHAYRGLRPRVSISCNVNYQLVE